MRLVRVEQHRWLNSSLLLLLLTVMLTSLLMGETSIPFTSIFSSADSIEHSILVDLRLPRILLAALVGAGLAVSGTAIQGIFRNPLADPALIGVSAGAALGATLVMVFWNHAPAVAVSLSAFAGGLVVTAMAFKIASLSRQTRIANLLLAGIAINALAAAAIALLSYLADANQLKQLVFWTMGSFTQASWKTLLLTSLMVAPALFMLPRLSNGLNRMLLGDRESRHLGYCPESIKRKTVTLVALAVGAMVAATGVIGFVGLVIPHLGRFLVGPDHRYLFPVAALSGAVLLVLSDLLARLLLSPVELPVGMITALLGVPFFVWLLIRA